MRRRIVLLMTAFFLLSLGCNTQKAQQGRLAQGKKPKNIILMIGDGMGLSQITAGMYVNSNYTVFQRFPIVGLLKTHSHSHLITDSAAGATAYACGKKTYNGAIAVDPMGQPLETIAEKAHTEGLKTGVVATSTITHATPACFYAHNKSRKNYEEIAADLSASDIDVAIGYGRNEFNERSDEKDLLAQMEDRGFTVAAGLREKQLRQADKLAVILAGEPPKMDDRPVNYLRDASELAIEVLNKGDKGFFLMIEGSQIDWGGHANDSEWIIDEMIDFDKTVSAVMDYAEADGETLVIVTADHETGGYAINEGDLREGTVVGQFTSTQHTATMIPIFAYGPGSEYFTGVYDNTEVYSKMMDLFQFELARKE